MAQARGFEGFAPMALRPEPICAPEGAETLSLFLYFSVHSFTVETASTNALLCVSKSRTPSPLRLFPCLQLTRRRMAGSIAQEVRLQQETPGETVGRKHGPQSVEEDKAVAAAQPTSFYPHA